MRDFCRYQRPAPRNDVSDALIETADVDGLDEEVEFAVYNYEEREEQPANA